LKPDLTLGELAELSGNPETLWAWREASKAVIARQRLRLHQDINAAINPSQWRDFREGLIEQAYERDHPMYESLLIALAEETTRS
jgi:hypothetical protein